MAKRIVPDVLKVVTKKAAAKKIGNSISKKKSLSEKLEKPKKVEKHSVVSTNLKKVEYDSDRKLLTVTFNTNRTYQYFGVPASLHARLLLAVSKGKFFHKHVRQNFKYKEV